MRAQCKDSPYLQRIGAFQVWCKYGKALYRPLLEAVEEGLKRLSSGGSRGLDGLQAPSFKTFKSVFVPHMFLMQQALAQGCLLESWFPAIVIVIPKETGIHVCNLGIHVCNLCMCACRLKCLEKRHGHSCGAMSV